MAQNVQVYIYDLSQGLAKTIGPALIGRPLDGIWHTSVVVYGNEYYFGGAGIESCSPGSTMLGAPLKVENLGETGIPLDVFNDYLKTQSQDRFRGDKYDLLKHNCNNFSEETAQFLTGKGIPKYILDLPNEILATPLGQMLAPMIKQMTPSGNAIPFTMGQAIERTGLPPDNQQQSMSSSNLTNGRSSCNSSSTGKPLPVLTPILLDNPLNIEGMKKKLDEFNAKEVDNQLTDTELKVFFGIAKGLVRLSRDNMPGVLKMALTWQPEHRFPTLDLLRHKCVRLVAGSGGSANETGGASTGGDPLDMSVLVGALVSNLEAGEVNAMLATAALCNFMAKHEHRSLIEQPEALIEKMASLLPTTNRKLEMNVAAFLHNLTIHPVKESVAGAADSSRAEANLDLHIFLLSSILSNLQHSVTQVESKERLLISLGNILYTGKQEVVDLAHTMEIQQYLNKMESDGVKPEITKEVKNLLRISMDGIDLE